VTLPEGRGRVAVVGAGIVGARTVRELIGPGADGQPTTDGVVLVSRREDRLRELSPIYGERVATVRADALPALPDDVGVVVVAREQGAQVAVVEAAVRQGRHVVVVGDDPDDVEALLTLSGAARDAGVALVVGVAMAPGLSCVLARHSRYRRLARRHVPPAWRACACRCVGGVVGCGGGTSFAARGSVACGASARDGVNVGRGVCVASVDDCATSCGGAGGAGG
jgi:siroheme synthase (precorrin-2 oxidase/ferrochelatase)